MRKKRWFTSLRVKGKWFAVTLTFRTLTNNRLKLVLSISKVPFTKQKSLDLTLVFASSWLLLALGTKQWAFGTMKHANRKLLTPLPKSALLLHSILADFTSWLRYRTKCSCAMYCQGNLTFSKPSSRKVWLKFSLPMVDTCLPALWIKILWFITSGLLRVLPSWRALDILTVYEALTGGTMTRVSPPAAWLEMFTSTNYTAVMA